ncbi:MAG: Hsp20 family protein [Ilumatobacter sp.]|nr:Hsp20 family protein [Ilumatobacter sp.]MBT5278059.1 Hsp20 family protein [Ilumatobacter sp.]MBT5555028.1 Hsp20 family protein [Ilumatobacter sp.]MBT5864717.1 Hsp20 family protein [Ilumatobacter sp.]
MAQSAAPWADGLPRRSRSESAPARRSIPRSSTAREEGDRFSLAERHPGTFRRQVNLGEGLDADGIEADYHDGVLTLRVPVAQQAKPRKIEIRNAGLDVDPALETSATD